MQLSKLKEEELIKFKDFLASLSFSDEEIDRIIKTKELILYDDSIIMYNAVVNFKFLLDRLYIDEKEYKPEKIKKIMLFNPKLFILSKKNLEENWQNLLDLSVSDSITSIIKNDNPGFIHFSEHDVQKMVENKPEVICTDINNVSKRISYLKEIGYTKENIMHMASIAPTILVQDYDKIKDKISFLANLKYSKADIIKITTKFPSFYDYNIDALDERFFLIELLGLHNVVLDRPFIIRQSPKLTYARYMFFQDNGISIENNNRKIFLQESKFKQIYHKSNEELLSDPKYDYQKLLNEKAKIFTKREKKS